MITNDRLEILKEKLAGISIEVPKKAGRRVSGVGVPGFCKKQVDIDVAFEFIVLTWRDQYEANTAALATKIEEYDEDKDGTMNLSELTDLLSKMAPECDKILNDREIVHLYEELVEDGDEQSGVDFSALATLLVEKEVLRGWHAKCVAPLNQSVLHSTLQ